MEFEEYKARLAFYLPYATSEDEAVPQGESPVITAPYSDFFGEPLFLMLFNCDARLPPELDSIRRLLHGVADVSRTDQERAKDALDLAKIADERCSSQAIKDTSTIEQFLTLAVGWGSVMAHAELAEYRLKAAGLMFTHENELDALPSVKSIDSLRKSPYVLARSGVRELWQAGADLTLAVAESDFAGWNAGELTAGFICVAYSLAIPTTLLGSRAIDRHDALKLEQWALPLLKRLVGRIGDLGKYDPAKLKDLRRQTQAIGLMLSAATSKAGEMPADDDRPDSFESDDTDTVIVIKGVIPKASDKADNDLLAQYEALRKPMALAAMPSRDQIELIQVELGREFPWAVGAIETIMSEIRARRRFGSRVLGMQPVLLCGPPGTGKSRMSQRLSELLAIPSTVINMSGMTDTKTLKGVTRGWASNRSSRIVESILRTGPSHLFLLDEVDKSHGYAGGNGGDPQEALLDLLEPVNARRYGDVFLQTECDVSHCLYVLTANSVARISEPLLSRLSLAYVPAPGPEYSATIAHGVLRDLEKMWRIPEGALQLDPLEMRSLVGLSPREMRRAILAIFGDSADLARYTLH